MGSILQLTEIYQIFVHNNPKSLAAIMFRGLERFLYSSRQGRFLNRIIQILTAVVENLFLCLTQLAILFSGMKKSELFFE